MDAIVTSGLVKKFGELKAVDGVSFRIKKGEIVGLLGPNGAGKTTTVRMLACIIPPTEGTATVGGYEIRKEQFQIKRIIGLLPENPSLYERLSAVENLDFYAKLYDVPKSVKVRRSEELLAFFGLSERKHDKVGTYSKGMKQKLALVRTLIHDPEILFLDELTAGLDPATAREVREAIRGLAKKERRTIFLCSHNLAEVEKLCTKVIIINAGRIVGEGPATESEKMLKRKTPYRVEIRLGKITRRIVKKLQRLDCTKGLRVLSNNRLVIELIEDKSIPQIIKEITREGGEIFSLTPLKTTLEDVYLKLVGE